MRARIIILISYFLITFPFWPVHAQNEKSTQPPLFNINYDFDFSNSDNEVREVKKIILENYYSPKLTEKDLDIAAIKGMLQHVSPPYNKEHSKLMKPEEAKKFEQQLAGKTVSIGIKGDFNSSDASLVVTEVIPGSPSDGHLEPLDRILRIDGKKLVGMTTEAVNKLIEGEENTKVSLTVVRDIKVFDVRLTRQEYKTPNLKAFMLPDNIGMIEMKVVTDNIADELRNEVKKFWDKGIKKIVLDLRGNPGGVLREGLRMADIFLPPQHVSLRIVTQLKEPQKVTTSDDVYYDVQLAVLVNKNTGSSCEVFAAAMQDHKKAKIIGTNSYGKSLIDKVFPLSNGFKIKIITGTMYGPLGKTWYVQGVKPDIEVAQDLNLLNELYKRKPDERLNDDAPLLSAHNYLKNL